MKYPHLSPPIIANLAKLAEKKVRPLDKAELRCVSYFVRNPNTNISDCYKSVEPYVADKKRNRLKKPDIQNIRKAAKNLVTKKLLEVSQKDHTVYYHLTDYGVYYVLYQNESLFEEAFPYIVYNYGNNIIFESFLSPYFNLNTVASLNLVFSAIRTYLMRCFKELQLYFENKELKMSKQVFTWTDLDYRSSNLKALNESSLKTFLRDELHLDWIDNSVTVKHPSNNTLEISTGDNILSISINPVRNKAFVFMNNRNIYTFNVSSIKVPKGDREEEVRCSLIAPDANANTFALSALSMGLQINLELLVEEFISRGLLQFSKAIISTDRKFCQLINTIRPSFERKLDILKELEKACKKPS